MRRFAFLMVLLALVMLDSPGSVPRVGAQSVGVPQKIDALNETIAALHSTVASLQQTVETLQGAVNTVQDTLDVQQEVLSGFSESGVPSAPRRYYVSPNAADGLEAPAACAAGFHMANLFEFITFSGVEYDTDRGLTRADSGEGPPTFLPGWLRTGFVAGAESTGFAGKVNCNAWTSNSSMDFGTVVELNAEWSVFFAQSASHPPFREAEWLTPARVSCDTRMPVWCIEDR